ncbi:hypothetical protein [Actinomadura sp. 9N215]|uniref:hypothetical protein n=1 Tax=Actinomadura sp. 9N215 TaxID=3375150 RepID=UPI0037BFA215
MPPFVYRATKYDPAARDAQGHYVANQHNASDHESVEAAYLEAATTSAAAGRAELLEENPVEGVSRWYRLGDGGIDQTRERLTPPAPGWRFGRI